MTSPEAMTVSELMWRLKDAVEDQFPWMSVQGELSNVRRAASGHIYFTLKDDRAQVSGVVWSRTASRLRFRMTDGLAVIVTGPLDVYPARGSVQLIVEHVIPQGLGALELAFRQLHQKLAAEGLFDAQHKKPLPTFPRRIGLITSPTGAAVRDMLRTICQRWRGSDVLVIPAAVQGPNAGPQLVRALRHVARLRGIDVVILGRGGGSLEDLWAFNLEPVARAVFECPIPIVSAVGHEVDIAITDLVADVRAATPTAAGQLVVPDAVEIRERLESCSARARRALRNQLAAASARVQNLSQRRVLVRPSDTIRRRAEYVDALADRLRRAVAARVATSRESARRLTAQLDALSPLKVLSRGYSITEDAGGSVLRSVSDVEAGTEITTRLIDGAVVSRVFRTPDSEEQK